MLIDTTIAKPKYLHNCNNSLLVSNCACSRVFQEQQSPGNHYFAENVVYCKVKTIRRLNSSLRPKNRNCDEVSHRYIFRVK